MSPDTSKNLKSEKGYRKLFAWQKSDEMAYQIYLETKSFPKEEIYGITSQLRRSALSVPVNLAEGVGRQNKKELRQFVNIALGSLSETEYLLEFCLRLGYLESSVFEKLESFRQETGNICWKFYLSL